jgi:hypothetical protein
LSYGVSGSQKWKNTSLNLDYHGDFRHYTQASYYDGTDQTLNLQLEHRLARHVTFALGVSGGTYTYRFGYTGAFGSYDPFFYAAEHR